MPSTTVEKNELHGFRPVIDINNEIQYLFGMMIRHS